MPQTIRLEFAKSNTKVSKPKQPAAAAATSHPALMHPLTGRKYAPPLVHSLDTSHNYSHPLHRTTTYLPPCCFSISFSLLLPPPPVVLERIFLLFLSSFFFFISFSSSDVPVHQPHTSSSLNPLRHSVIKASDSVDVVR